MPPAIENEPHLWPNIFSDPNLFQNFVGVESHTTRVKKEEKSMAQERLLRDYFLSGPLHETSKEALELLYKKYKGITVDSDTFVGIEVEVENIRGGYVDGIFIRKEDGSLRNNGAEFVSIPMRARYAIPALDKLFTYMSTVDIPKFTHRTSIHVHVNVGDLTLEELKVMTLVYIAFENIFFEIAGQKRKNGIFCVPLTNSGYQEKINYLLNLTPKVGSMAQTFQSWHKYTGYNLAPVRSLCTAEFRHLYGTNDVGLLALWISMITKLHDYAKGKTVPVVSTKLYALNTSSEYFQFMCEVFDEVASNFSQLDHQSLMEESVTYIKECIHGVSDIKKNTTLVDEVKECMFFKLHNIEERSFKGKYYDPDQSAEYYGRMSVAALKETLNELLDMYHNTDDYDFRNKASNHYGIITNILAARAKKDK